MENNAILVRDWMSSPVHTVGPETGVAEAYNLMMQMAIRRLAVVDHEKVLGIVTIGDLREARPSPATSLSIYELNYQLAKLKVGEVMTHDPFTVSPTTSLQEAARLMLSHKIGGLLVVDAAGRLVGIITESDVFRLIIERWDDLSARPAPGAVAN